MSREIQYLTFVDNCSEVVLSEMAEDVLKTLPISPMSADRLCANLVASTSFKLTSYLASGADMADVSAAEAASKLAADYDKLRSEEELQRRARAMFQIDDQFCIPSFEERLQSESFQASARQYLRYKSSEDSYALEHMQYSSHRLLDRCGEYVDDAKGDNIRARKQYLTRLIDNSRFWKGSSTDNFIGDWTVAASAVLHKHASAFKSRLEKAQSLHGPFLTWVASDQSISNKLQYWNDLTEKAQGDLAKRTQIALSRMRLQIGMPESMQEKRGDKYDFRAPMPWGTDMDELVPTLVEAWEQNRAAQVSSGASD